MTYTKEFVVYIFSEDQYFVAQFDDVRANDINSVYQSFLDIPDYIWESTNFTELKESL